MSERRGLELSATQLIASGLATTTAAVAASYLGVAGTIIGAGFMSVATTTGAAIYQHYLDRGKRYTTLAATREDRAPGPADTTAETTPETETPADTAPETETPADTAAEATVVQEERSRIRVRWYAVAAAAVAIFAVVMGGITLVESATNKPISAMLGGPERSGTSLGQAFGDEGSTPTDQPATPSTSPSAAPSGSTAPTATPQGPAKPSATTGSAKPPATTAPTTPPPPPPTTGGATPTASP